MTQFAIAALQLNLKKSNNLDLVISKVRGTLARFPWVNMVVVSELAANGCSLVNAVLEESEIEDLFCEVARDLGIWFVPGSFYVKEGNNIFNMSPVINPHGEIIRRYNKIYPFLPYEIGVSPGRDICIFDVPDVGRFGVYICYDMWFPEVGRAMVNEGVEVILHPTLTDTHDRDVECAMVRSTAAQFQTYMINVNGAGELGNGRSLIVGPEGDVIHASGEVEDIVAIEIDLDRVRRTRERGIMGLGQPLKSYRDAEHEFGLSSRKNSQDYLSSLGPLEIPRRRSTR
jgi:predicted amidohydrolase